MPLFFSLTEFPAAKPATVTPILELLLTQSMAILFILAEIFKPDPLVTLQVCAGFIGLVNTVTE